MDAPIKVVLVDDNACMVWGLKHLMAQQEPSMIIADTVSRRCDVLQSVRQHQPDVVLLEIALEEESGPELISLVNEGCATKIIVFTCLRDPVLHEKAILSGARGLVLKSEPVDVVLRAIKAVHAGELWLKRDVTAKIVGILSAAYHQSASPLSSSIFTPSENRVIAAAVKYRGAPNKVIADVLHMSANTFRNHLSTIYGKLGIHRRLDLVLYGIQHGAGEQAEMPVSGSAGLGLRFMPGTSAVMPVPQVNGSSGAPGGQGETGGEMVGSPRQRAGPALRARGGDGKAAEDAALAGINAYLCNHPAASVPVIGDHPGSVRLIKHMGPTGSTRINRR